MDIQGSFTIANRANNAFVEYSKESLIEAFFNGIHNALSSLASTYSFSYTKNALYKSGSNYVMEVTLPKHTTGTPVVGSATGFFTVNIPNALVTLMGYDFTTYGGSGMTIFDRMSVGTSTEKWRYTTNIFSNFPSSDGVENDVFDGSSEAFIYGITKPLTLSSQNTSFIGRLVMNGDGDLYRRYWNPLNSTFLGTGFHLTGEAVMPFNGGNGQYGVGDRDVGTSTYRWRTVYTTNSADVSSDDRLKHNEEDVVDALGTIKKLKLLKYDKTNEMLDADYNGDLTDIPHKKEIGFIAQSVLEIPELAFLVSVPGDPEEELEPGLKRGEGVYGLDYQGINNLLVQAVQELSARVEALEK